MLLVRVTNVSSSDLMMALNTSLAKGGPDGRFTLKPTAESPYGFGDLRPYHPDTVSFIGQAFHLTANRTYTDTLNFLILKESMSATLKVHSISLVISMHMRAMLRLPLISMHMTGMLRLPGHISLQFLPAHNLALL